MTLPTNITARVVPVFPANVVGGTGVSVTKSGGVYTIAGDFDQYGSAQGTMLFRNATVWTGLAPGTSGQVLRSGGPTGDPSWQDDTPVADGSITTAKLADGAVTFVKMQDIATDRLLGRATAGSGSPEEITLGGGVELNSGALQREALTGDVTASAGNNATTIANDAVTFAKFQNVSTGIVVGRSTAATGDAEELTPSAVLDLIGNTQGAIVSRGASAWSALSPGTSGQVLTSQGAAADLIWQTPSGGGSSTPSFGGELQFVSTTGLKLEAVTGDTHSVPNGSGGWTQLDISTAPTVDTTGLASTTSYFAYLYDSSGATLELSDTGPTWDQGVEVKTGAVTRLLVGYVRTNGSTQFQDDDEGRLVRSYYNRNAVDLSNVFSAVETVTAGGAFEELNSSFRLGFMAARGDGISTSVSGHSSNNSASGLTFSASGLNGATTVKPEAGTATFGQGVGGAVGASGFFGNLTPGYTYVTYVGKSVTDTGSFGLTNIKNGLNALLIPGSR